MRERETETNPKELLPDAGLDVVLVERYAAYCDWRPALTVSRDKAKGVKISRYHGGDACAGLKKGRER